MSAPETTGSRGIHLQLRRADGRVASAYSNADLYEIVEAAARRARPDEPDLLSMNEFDRTLNSIGFPDAPSARAIYGRLKQPWRTIVETSLQPRDVREQVEETKRKADEAPWLGARHLFYSINTICRIQEVETLDERDYDRWREEHISSIPGASERQQQEELLPTANQILRISAKLPVPNTTLTTPAWTKALLYAGRKPYTQAVATGMPIIEAIDLYIDATESTYIPFRSEIERLAAEWDVSVAKRIVGKPWEDYITEVRVKRDAKGLVTPTVMPDPKALPQLTRPADLEAKPRKSSKGAWKDTETVIAALTPFVLDCQAAGDPPTRGRYLKWRKTNPAPAPSTIERDQPFSQWIHVVQDRLLEAKKAA